MRVTREHIGRLSPARVTEEGFLAFDGIATRVGVFEYRKSDGSIRREYRSPEEVERAESLDTLRRKPITLQHPTDAQGKRVLVTPLNAREHSKGALTDDVTLVDAIDFAPDDERGPYVKVSGIIYDAEALKSVTLDEQVALSCGYEADVIMEPGVTPLGEPYDAIQRNITYNHLALVPRGRAGESARLRLDSADDQIGIFASTHPTPHTTPAPDPVPRAQEMSMKLKLKNGMVVELKGDSANVQDQYDALRTVVADAEAMPSIKSDMDAMQKRVDQMMLDMAASNEKLDEYDARMDGLKKMFGEFMEEEGLVSDEDGAMKEELIEEMFKGDAAEAVKGRLTVLRKKAGTRRVAAIRERLQLEGHAKTLKVDSAETLEPLALRRAMLAKLTGEEYRADASEAEVKGALEMALKYQSRGANTSSNAASQTAAGITEGRSQIADAADQTVSAREKYIAAQAAASKRS